MTTIKLRRGTAAEWTSSNPVLNDGEVGFEHDTNKHKIGDGVTAWSALKYFINETALDARFAAIALTTRFDVEAILIAGAATTGTNMVPPGIRVPRATTLSAVHVRVGTAPTGAALTVVTKLDGSIVATTTVAASAAAQSTTGLTVAAVAGQILTFDITSIGSTVPGSDVAVQVIGS